jgi:hypothetical protein
LKSKKTAYETVLSFTKLKTAATTQAYETKNFFAEELQYYEQLQAMKREANFLALTANNTVSFVQKVDAPPIDRLQVRVVYRELARLLIGIDFPFLHFFALIFCKFFPFNLTNTILFPFP